MSGNHPSELSPRQRMINMMYLVLTALLALNVSKEVLNSFFEVNLGLVKTTESLDKKSDNTYKALNEFSNTEKSKPYIALTDQIKPKAGEVTAFIQEMKYDLVYSADKGKVYLGEYDDGAEDEENDKFLKEDILFNDLGGDKNKKIAWLGAKDDRNSSGALFNPDNKQKLFNVDGKGRATLLKEKIVEYRQFLLDILSQSEKSSLITEGSASQLISEINNSLEIKEGEKYGKKGNKRTWEYHNFYDMPAVGALTLLSKWQADIKNIEGEVAEFLAANIDATDLKFSSAIATTIPSTNFVTTGDNFKSQIFLSAYDDKSQPEIYIGDYDSSEVNGEYIHVMKDQTTPKLEVFNGKGDYTVKTGGIGPKKYKGIIKIVQDKGFKTYSFRGSYVVAAKGAVAAPTNMNVLYKGIENPISVSVAGYLPSQVTVSCSNGKLSTVSKGKGEYVITPTKLHENKPIVTLYATRDGKKMNMGSIDFKVKNVPPPEIICAKQSGGIISKGDLSSASGLFCVMRDFPFDRNALSYQVVSYDVSAYNKGVKRNIPTIRNHKFNKEVRDAIKGTAPGNDISFTNIKVKLRGVKGARMIDKASITFTIK